MRSFLGMRKVYNRLATDFSVRKANGCPKLSLSIKDAIAACSVLYAEETSARAVRFLEFLTEIESQAQSEDKSAIVFPQIGDRHLDKQPQHQEIAHRSGQVNPCARHR